MTRDVELNTFWGGRITGTLPEAVSSLIWRFGYFDYGVSQTLLETLKPGGVFIDVGAHFGFFSLLANWLVGSTGRVVSVEAMPNTFERLMHNLNNHTTHKVFDAVNVAAYCKEDELTFQDYGLTFSSLNSAFGVRNESSEISSVHEIKVRAQPLDDIVAHFDLPKIDLVKIDAESSELYVLQGMSWIIEQHSPDIIVEIGDVDGATGGTSREIVDLLASSSYSPWRRRGGKLEPVQIKDSYGYDNFVFKPDNKQALL